MMSRSSNRQQDSKKTMGFWIGGGVAALLLFGGGYLGFTTYQTNQQQQKNKAVVEKFTNELKQQKFDHLNQLISTKKSKNSNYETQAIVDKYQNIFSGITAENIAVKNLKVKKRKDVYTFSYILSMTTALGKLKNLNYKGTLVEEKGQPRIKWAPNLIFPQMSGKDKVSINVAEPARGTIKDRNGKELAVNQEFNQIGVIPNKLGSGTEKATNIQQIAAKYELTEKEINDALNQSWVKADYFVPLKTLGLGEEVSNLPTGVTLQTVTMRYYPLKEAAAQLVGYVGTVSAEDIKNNPKLPSSGVVGKTGLEASFDAKLRGISGGTLAVTDENGNEKEVLAKVEKKDGEDIQLTIDSQAQQLAYQELDNQKGAAVVTNPQNGDLLAAVSSPSYDPNLMAHGISQAQYDAYSKDEARPFTNRFTNRYAPGSTFKTITAAIGLDAGTIDPNEQLPISGLKWQKDASWGSYEVTRVSDVPSAVDLKTSLVYSDNIYMAQQVLKMGAKTFIDGLNKFIFGEKLNLPIAMNPAQISNSGKLDQEILLADTGYGQGELLINSIQQATMYSVFANNGTLVYPRILASEKTKSKENVISENAAKTITTDMEAVVNDIDGTAHNLATLGFPLAAKTGTAEIKEKQDEKGQENSFLFAFNPEKRNYLLVNFLENRAEGQSAANHSETLLSYLNNLN